MVDPRDDQFAARRRTSEARERAIGGPHATTRPPTRPAWRPRWQGLARLGLAIGLTGFSAVVVLRIQERVEPPVAARVIDRLDPDAVIESTGVELVRSAGGEENFALTAPRQLTSKDGSTRFFGGMSLTVTERADRQSFIVTGTEANMDDTETDFTVTDDVQLTVSDGLVVRTGTLVYTRGQSLVTMEDGPGGPTTISRSGLEASGRNPVHDLDRAITTLPEAATVRLTGDGDRAAVTIESARATLAPADGYMHFEGGTAAVTGPMVLESETMTARFGEEETELEQLELRGDARIYSTESTSGAPGELRASAITLTFEETTRTVTRATLRGDASIGSTAPAPGGLSGMRARAMTVIFEDTTGAVEQSLLTGAARIDLVGSDGSRGARISAAAMDVTTAPDGGDVTALEAWDGVRLGLPDTPDGAQQEIRAARLIPNGPPGAEMTAVRFDQDVEYHERRAATGTAAAVRRVIRAERLDAGVAEGLSALVEARFLGHVSFEDGTRGMAAAEVVYNVTGGLLTLSSVPDAGLTPRVIDATSRIEAATITVAVDGSRLEASGGVTSEVTPAGPGNPDTPESTPKKLPALLEADQQVLVSADALRYLRGAGGAGQTTYSGKARLWQGGTSFEGDTLAIDDQTGNLTATGNVRTRIQLTRLNETTQRSEVSPTHVKTGTFVYDDAARHAVYTTTAVLLSEHGDLKADTIKIFLEADARTLDRLEATGNVTLGLNGRWATGEHLVYYEAEGRYEMEGAPVEMVEEVDPEEPATPAPPRPGATPPRPSCSSTTGRTLTFFRSTDTMVVDGREVARTQTGSGTCTPPTF